MISGAVWGHDFSASAETAYRQGMAVDPSLVAGQVAWIIVIIRQPLSVCLAPGAKDSLQELVNSLKLQFPPCGE